MDAVRKICISLFKFLASLKLAVIVILGFAYVLAMGTIYESLYGTPVAKEKVYGTIWFSLLLLLLGINVLCAALSRLPWKKHHIGFVVTHAGIITILIGSFITQKYGVDGTMALAEGEVGDKVLMDDSLLQVAIPDLGLVETWKAKFEEKNNESLQRQRRVEGEAPAALPMEGATQAPIIDKSIIWSKKLKDNSHLMVDHYFPHSEMKLKVSGESKEDNPALKVNLSNLPFEAGNMSEWVFEKESSLFPSTLQIGPAKISFVSLNALEKLQASAPAPSTDRMGSIELTFPDGKKVEFQASKALKEEIAIEGTSYKVKGLRYLPDAVVRKNKLVTRSENPNNPAYEFEIRGPDFQETHIVFARFPDLEGVHGKEQKSGIKALYKVEEGMQALGQAELYLSVSTKGEIFYRIRSKQGLSEIQKIKVGETKATGWMTIQFQVEEYIPNALAEIQYRNVKMKKGMKDGPAPAIHARVEKDGKFAQAWLQQGDMKVLTLDGNPYVVRYGLRSYPVGFQVKLDKFQVLRYPGTESPSAFESFVTVTNEKTKAKFNTKIYMNNPLHYQGYTFYQSSYQENPGQPTISIFSISRDPGTPVKYVGSILFVSGIALMFWFKPLFVKKKMEARKLAEKAQEV